MSSQTKGIIIGVVGVFAALWLYGEGLKNGATPTVTQPPVSISPTGGQPVEVQWKAGFMSTCNKSGKLYSYCSCTWDTMRQTYSLEDIGQMGTDYQKTGQYPEGMQNAIYQCAGKLNAQTYTQ